MIFQRPTSTTRKVQLTFKSTLSDLPRAETEAVKHDTYFHAATVEANAIVPATAERKILAHISDFVSELTLPSSSSTNYKMSWQSYVDDQVNIYVPLDAIPNISKVKRRRISLN